MQLDSKLKFNRSIDICRAMTLYGRLPKKSLQETIEREKQRQQLKKQIFALEKKIKREKQFNRQVEMNSLLKKLRKELEELT